MCNQYTLTYMESSWLLTHLYYNTFPVGGLTKCRLKTSAPDLFLDSFDIYIVILSPSTNDFTTTD